MKLFWSSRSPFVRKVMVVAHELGLQDRIALERVIVTARDGNAAVMAMNPLNQIPTLVLDDGTTLFDSVVIVEFLDLTFGTGALLPRDPALRWPVLRLQTLGDGLMRMNVTRLGEQNRGQLASPLHAEALRVKTMATLDALEREVPTWATLSVGGIAVATGLSHLDFRFTDDAWRIGRPALAAWFEGMRARPSMRATEPENSY
jgi:glutathione S-transferase